MQPGRPAGGAASSRERECVSTSPLSNSQPLRRVELRRRICKSCASSFEVCVPCDRGQRYCGPECASRGRRSSARAARRTHRRSPEGRADHRDAERRRRARRREGVGDQPSGKLTDAAIAPAANEDNIRTSAPNDVASVVAGTRKQNPRQSHRDVPERFAVRVAAAKAAGALGLLGEWANGRCRFCGRPGLQRVDGGVDGRSGRSREGFVDDVSSPGRPSSRRPP